MQIKSLLVVIIYIACGGLGAYNWPNDIKRCTLDATDLDKCLMEAAIDAIPKLANGSKKLGIRPLDPFTFVNLSISSNRPIISLDFKIPEGTITGGTKLTLKNISYDKIKNILALETIQEKVTISGSYKIRGKLFLLNLKSSGDFKLVARNLEGYNEVHMIPTKKEGFYKMGIKYKINKLGEMKMSFEDSILPPLAEEAFNNIVNDNWKTISEAFIPTMETSVSEIYKQALSPMLKRFSLATIFAQHTDSYGTESEEGLEAEVT